MYETDEVQNDRADVCYSTLCAEPPRLELDSRWLSEIGVRGLLDSLPEPKEYCDLGTGFSEIILTARIIEVIRLTRQIIIYDDLSRQGVLASHLFDNSIFVAAEHQLLNARYADPLTAVQECVCIGMILYSMACLRRTASFAHARTPLSRLASLLSTPEVVQDFDSNTTELLIWFLWTAYCVSKQGHFEHYQWYLARLRETLVSVGVSSPEGLKRILGRFFFLERTCGNLAGIFTG